MFNKIIRMAAVVALAAFVGALAGCATDTEVERTRLPGIDKYNEKK